ncbi:MAG TPA: flagellar hook protein FliD [Candidatus Marinimicrobia bacterium]|nr:flagellar hook protein FliD [Candidatus Neomarinimicrobiota bacterium]
MAIDAGSIFTNQSSIEQLIGQYLALESRPRDDLVVKKDTLNSRKNILSELDSKLSALESKAERLNDPITDYFAAKLATSSDTDKFTVSASSSAGLGNHTFSVDRLAVSDTRVSKQFTDSDTSFSGFSTDQTFKIELAHPTDEDPSNRVSINILMTADKFSQNDDQVLADIAGAINSAMFNAVSSETIENNEVVYASVVNEESGKSRLVLRTEQSGYTYRLDFTDSADNLLQSLEVNAAVQSSGTSGGYMTFVGTSATDSLLNSKFTMDGLTFYRDSNNVTDALTGVTLQLLSTFSTTETITVNVDTESVKGEVKGVLDAYNEALTFLRTNTQMDPATYKAGALSNDTTYRRIINELRGIASGAVSGVNNSDYSRLFSIGIKADDKGLLSITDSEKFTEALESNTANVSDLFRASDGIAVEIDSFISNFVKTGGTIDNSKKNIDDQVTYLSGRISSMDEWLLKRETQLRDEFARLQDAMSRISSQQSFFSMFQ